MGNEPRRKQPEPATSASDIEGGSFERAKPGFATTAPVSHTELGAHAGYDPLRGGAPPVQRWDTHRLSVVSREAYEVSGEIGRGGLGRVLHARDPRLGRPVALKELLDAHGGGTERFLREAVLTARLQHPAIVPVYEVGCWPSGEPFYAMKLVSGRSLDMLIDEARSLDKRLSLLPHVLAAAEAVAYAHRLRIIHRDLKPANVLVGELGETVVIDWGLAKDLAEEDAAAGRSGNDGPKAAEVREGEALTVVGAVLGTPAYMAPEQARGLPADERADVYALGAILYQLLAGELPYRGKSARDVVDQVAALPPPALAHRHPGIPLELVAITEKAMNRDQERRYPTAKELADDLRRFQTGQIVAAHRYSWPQLLQRFARRNRALAAAALAVPLLVALAVLVARVSAARSIDRNVTLHMDAGRSALDEARGKEQQAEALRRGAFDSFRASDIEGGEAVWQRALALSAEVDRTYARASQELEIALRFDGARDDVRALLGDALYERATLAERDRRLAQRDELMERLATCDDNGERRKRWNAPAHIDVHSAPAGAEVLLQRFEPPDRRVLSAPRVLGTTPLNNVELQQGSFLLSIGAAGPILVRVPVALERAERVRIDIDLPPAGAVPEGFVYVPTGRFRLGTADEGRLRTMLRAQPIHAAETGAYLIAKHETTFADWMTYLRALPPKERAQRTPAARSDGHGVTPPGPSAELKPLQDGGFELALRPTVQDYRAREGELLHYPDRTVRADQDWRKFPVSAVSFEDAQAYAAWLDRTGRVRGARLCSELEWERAARGADDRLFPNGDRLDPGDANHDVTYGNTPLALGPDEIGMSPASDSPFGVHDLAGNVWEWTVSVERGGNPALRGGGWYHDALAAAISNRETIEPTLRHVLIGVRLCATPVPP